MNLIGQFLSPQDVLLDLNVSNKNQLLDEVANFIASRHGLDQAKVWKAWWAASAWGPRHWAKVWPSPMRG
jgi:hypothetical protein